MLPLSDGFGLHAGMPGFKKLWDSKELAIVHGVGFADPNYSHFESMDIWQAGSTDAATSTGWLGRWLDGTKSSPLRAIALGPTLPAALEGAGPGRRHSGRTPHPPRHQHRAGALRVDGNRRPQRSLPHGHGGGLDKVLLELRKQLGPVLARETTSNPLHISGLSSQLAADPPSLRSRTVVGAPHRGTSWPCS